MPELSIDQVGGDILLLCSDGLTSMISEERVKEILSSAGTLEQRGDALIDEANEAGGRDNITVVLFRLEDVGADGDSDGDQPTVVAPPPPETKAPQETTPSPETKVPEPSPVTKLPRETRATAVPSEERRRRRYIKPLAALIAVVIVLFLIVGGGYLATRQLYFVGTNSQGIVTIYRGLPYDLPAGIHLYETFYVSGVPASAVPPDRRGALLNNNLRSQSDASNLVRQLETGQVSR